MIFVGIGNYTRLLTDPEYWNSIQVSLLFMIGTVFFGIASAIFLAIALSYPLRYLSGLHRLLIFVPIMISSAVTSVLFRWIYHPVFGYLNHALGLVGVEGPNWLNSKEWALIAVMFALAWRQLGFNVIIALAGIQNIDGTYYEAAKVDGANVGHRIRHITLPLLSPTLFFLLIINVIGRPTACTNTNRGREVWRKIRRELVSAMLTARKRLTWGIPAAVWASPVPIMMGMGSLISL